MTAFPRASTSELIAFYGDPDKGRDGLPDREWEAYNLVRVSTPYPMIMAWNGEPLKRIAVHKKCAASLIRALTEIGHEFSTKELESFQLNQFGGAYNFRTMRGATKLSLHAYGAAIDLAPELNPLGRVVGLKQNMMPEKAVRIFKSNGWSWGGLWKRPDGQHFQATRDA